MDLVSSEAEAGFVRSVMRSSDFGFTDLKAIHHQDTKKKETRKNTSAITARFILLLCVSVHLMAIIWFTPSPKASPTRARDKSQ